MKNNSRKAKSINSEIRCHFLYFEALVNAIVMIRICNFNLTVLKGREKI